MTFVMALTRAHGQIHAVHFLMLSNFHLCPVKGGIRLIQGKARSLNDQQPILFYLNSIL